MSTDMEERVARLDAMIAEGRVLRGQWTDGHERACLLVALSPEVVRARSVAACPAHVMPAWLAHMTPWIDDKVSARAWPGIIRRYASLARRWSVLDDAAWERARIASHIAIVREARTHCPPAEVWASWAASWAAAEAASRAAWWAAAAAYAAAEAAAEAWAAAEAADRIATAVLDAIEAEIEREEP